MGMFRRARRSEDGSPATDVEGAPAGVEDDRPEAEASRQTGADDADTAAGDRGPWDVADRPERGPRIDLGAVWLPGVDGMELRMETDEQRTVVTSAAVLVEGSTLQVQAFAAPRTAGIWDDIRAEIGESVTKQGGSADDLPGPFGRELLARLPVRTPDGRTSHRPARFIGVDGPRWFLRGVLSGPAAADPEAARVLEAVFADVVVVRGPEARAPRELLPLTFPQVPGAPAPTAAPDQRDPLDPFHRGPEITEVH